VYLFWLYIFLISGGFAHTMRPADEREVFAKTIYAEARGESREGWLWVAWVIKNRARMNKPYWGGSKIRDVCLHPYQFECWNGKNDISIDEPGLYKDILQLIDQIYPSGGSDPTGGADHYNNPAKEGYPAWVSNCDVVRRIGNHVFYKSKNSSASAPSTPVGGSGPCKSGHIRGIPGNCAYYEECVNESYMKRPNAPGTAFNPATGNFDHIGNVAGC